MNKPNAAARWQKFSLQQPISKELWQQVYALLSAALPPHERRDYAGQLALLQRPAYELYVYGQKQQVLAFIAAHQLGKLRYIEHFAVDEALRGQGLGGELLQEFCALAPEPVVLEAEPAESSALAQRRINFYGRHGFSPNPYPYLQPPLRSGDSPSPLTLLSYPTLLSQQQFEQVRTLLYQQVYDLPQGKLAQ